MMLVLNQKSVIVFVVLYHEHIRAKTAGVRAWMAVRSEGCTRCTSIIEKHKYKWWKNQ